MKKRWWFVEMVIPSLLGMGGFLWGYIVIPYPWGFSVGLGLFSLITGGLLLSFAKKTEKPFNPLHELMAFIGTVVIISTIGAVYYGTKDAGMNTIPIVESLFFALALIYYLVSEPDKKY